MALKTGLTMMCVLCRLYLADEQLLQSVTSVQQLANMETELEQAIERVRARKVRGLTADCTRV